MLARLFLCVVLISSSAVSTRSFAEKRLNANEDSLDLAVAGDDQQELERSITAMLPRHVGCAVLVVGKDAAGREVVFKRVYGMRTLRDEPAESLPANTETTFRLGTLTFPFTATAVLRLADEGVLALEDPITKWLPGVPASCRQITVQQLIDRSSGVIGHPLRLNCETHPSFNDYNLYEAFTASQGTEFDPGSRGGDGTVPFTLLGLIAERAAKQPFDVLLRERVLRSCGMKNGDVMVEGINLMPLRAHGYRPTWQYARFPADVEQLFLESPELPIQLDETTRRRSAPIQVEETAQKLGMDPSIWTEVDHGPFSRLRGSCALYASIDDLHAWINTLRYRTTPLSHKSWQLFLDPQSTPEGHSYDGRQGRRYTCGWVVDQQLGEPRFSSPGWTLTFLQTFQWLPESDRAVVVLMNSWPDNDSSNFKWGDRAMEELGERLMAEVLGELSAGVLGEFGIGK